MIGVHTSAGKRALARALAQHDPAFLSDIKMIGEKLGPFEAVYYESRDAATQRLVVGALAQAKREHIANSKANASGELQKMRAILTEHGPG